MPTTYNTPVCLLPPRPTKKELYFLHKVIGIEGGGVRNFIFFVTDMLEVNTFGCQSKGSLNSD